MHQTPENRVAILIKCEIPTVRTRFMERRRVVDAQRTKEIKNLKQLPDAGIIDANLLSKLDRHTPEQPLASD